MKLILGTMTFGPQVDLDGSRAMVRRFLDQGHTEIDAAYVYNNGDTERYLGEIVSAPNGTVRLATKVNPRVTGKLDRSAVVAQLDESLSRLKVDCVDVLYLHFPDPCTPIEVTLAACAELHNEGKFH